MQQVLFVGGEEKTLSLLKDYLKDRSPVIDTDNNILYIKDSVTDPDNNQVLNVLRKITTTADNKNIIIDDDENVSLKDSINLKGITVKPYDDAPSEYGNIVLGTISPTKTILLLSKISDIPGTISGDIFEVGDDINSAYHISLSNTGSRSLGGCSSKEKARFCQVVDINGTTWYGLKFINEDVKSTIYFHGFDTRPEENLPPTEYDDDFFESVNIVNDNADYASTIVDMAAFSSWDFTSIPSGWNNGVSNDGFDFGGGLVMRTGHASNIATGGTARPGEFGNNIGYLQIANSMRMSQNNFIELTIPRGQTALIYFTTTSTDNKALTVTLYDKDKETILGEEINSNMMRYSVFRYTNNSEYSKTTYICTEGGAVRFYYISNYDTNSVNPSDEVSNVITNLPPTGEDGDPNVIKLNGLVLTLADLNKFASVCKDSDQQLVLDLSNCTVANDAKIWNTTIFMDCNSLYTLYMPRGVTAIRNNVFSGCSFMDSIYLNPELVEIYGTAYGTSTIGVFGATQVRNIEITNPNLKLGGYWATASSFRYVIFPNDYTYSGGYGFLIESGAASDAWLTSVPSYMKLCFRENLIRQLKSDSNPWWFTNFGNGPQYSYALYGVDSKGNYLLAPWNEITSNNWQSGEIRWGDTVIFPAK